MISGSLVMFEARCRERGYTLDEVRPCIVAEDGDRITVDETHEAYPRVPRLPSLMTRVKNFAVAAAQHVAAGMPMASDDEIERRFAICGGCEWLVGGSCSKCGCPARREKAYLSKLSWADQKCPVGKW